MTKNILNQSNTEYESGTSFLESSSAQASVKVSGNADQVNGNGRPDNNVKGYWRFDGSANTYLQLDSQADFNLEDQDFVIDLWFWSNPNNTGNRALIGKWNNTTNQQSWYCFKQPAVNDNNITCYLQAGLSLFSLSTTSGTMAEQWYHLALTRNNNEVAIYLNGEQEAIIELTETLNNSGSDVIIGAYHDLLSANSLFTSKRLLIIKDIMNADKTFLSELLDYLPQLSDSGHIIIFHDTNLLSKKQYNKNEILIIDNSGQSKKLNK